MTNTNNTTIFEDALKDGKTTTDSTNLKINTNKVSLGTGGYNTRGSTIAQKAYEMILNSDNDIQYKAPIDPYIRTQPEGYSCSVTLPVYMPHKFGRMTLENTLKPIEAENEQVTVSVHDYDHSHNDIKETVEWVNQHHDLEARNAVLDLPSSIADILKKNGHYYPDTDGYTRVDVELHISAVNPDYA